MKVFQIISESSEGNYSYKLGHSILMAQQWFAKYAKSGDRYDYNTFREWVGRFTDDPVLQSGKVAYNFNIERDQLKYINSNLSRMLKDYSTQQWPQLQEDYNRLLSMIYALNYHIHQGWIPNGKTIMVKFDTDTLKVRWSGDNRWVEVRGTNYWQWKADDPLHQLIDRITGNKSDLMNGMEIAIGSTYPEYNELKNLLTESVLYKRGD